MKTIRVVAAIIIDNGKVFATQRGYGEFKDGWEFPGGKIDAGETPEEALVREIKEELDTEVEVAMMMIHNPATIAIGDSEEMKKAVKMLDEVKESIMNAYEIKTGLARDKISKLMDAESWFNAKKAVELGFADKILFADGQENVTENDGKGVVVGDEMSAPVMFSKQAVMNSMLSKLIPPKKPQEKEGLEGCWLSAWCLYSA